ncbi:hypothetical protein TruAng_006355 [Truncatella angustata]|nr:hypothetical protein TruAng_006355 [Truncatella angustata]
MAEIVSLRARHSRQHSRVYIMLAEMDVDYADLTNAQAVQLVGLAVGCIFVIPFTRKYGRRSTYIFSTALLAASCWWAAYMKSRVELYITSLLFGLAGAPNETVVQMSITDLFFLHQRASANAVYFVAVMMGSFLTPMIAGYQASITGWRDSYFALAIILTLLTVAFVPLFEETKYVPLTNDSDTGGRVQIPAESQYTPNSARPNTNEKDIKIALNADPELLAARVSSHAVGMALPRPNSWRQRLRFVTPTGEPLLKTAYYPLYTVCLPHVVFSAVQFAQAVCWLVVVSSMISIIFAAPPYSFDSAGLGYMFAGPFIGSIFGSIYGGPLLDRAAVYFARRNGGVYEPEMRLYLFPFQALVMAGGLIMFGITADKGWHWIYPSIGAGFFGFGMGASGDICFTMILDTYPELITSPIEKLVSEAFVLITFIRNSISIPGPFCITPWLAAMSVSNMFITAGLISLGVSLFCIPFLVWGKKWRVGLAPFYRGLCDGVTGVRR